MVPPAALKVHTQASEHPSTQVHTWASQIQAQVQVQVQVQVPVEHKYKYTPEYLRVHTMNWSVEEPLKENWMETEPRWKLLDNQLKLHFSKVLNCEGLKIVKCWELCQMREFWLILNLLDMAKSSGMAMIPNVIFM